MSLGLSFPRDIMPFSGCKMESAGETGTRVACIARSGKALSGNTDKS